MSEQDRGKLGLLQENLANESALDDPRNTQEVLGEQITLGETIHPDKEKYPGWSLTLFSYKNDANKDGCIFTVAANSATPIGLVERPPSQDESAYFTEWIIKGSGFLVIETPDGIVQKIEVSTNNPRVYRYGVGTKVAYVAGNNGLEGVNIGIPSQIPETPIADGDPRASDGLWKEYRLLTSSK